MMQLLYRLTLELIPCIVSETINGVDLKLPYGREEVTETQK